MLILHHFISFFISCQLDHFHHDFPFGTAVKALLIAGTTERDQKYQQTFYDNFNWAVLENSLKWRQMEPNKVGADSPLFILINKIIEPSLWW